MSTTARKPPPPGTPARDSTTKASGSPGPNRTPARASTPTSNGANGVQRTRSVRSSANGTPVSARAAVRKPGAASGLSMSSSQADENEEAAREEAAAALQELKDQLQKSQSDADERQKQIDVLNSRLDESLKEQAKLEERAHEEEEKVEALENEKKDVTRKHRELEGIYEAERAQTMKEKEETQAKEEELQSTIQRLKETMATKNVPSSDGEEGHLSRASSFRNNPSRNSSSQNLENSGSFAPPSSIQRSNSRNNSKLIHQKDKVIEGLRLELAEVQIKLVEMENAGGGRMRELEKQLLETRMTNARLMEDNESFQLLLSEKTLNGDLSRGDFLHAAANPDERAPSRNGPLNSLADELEDAEGAEGEALHRLQTEVNSLKDQNKALTLYINKIIGRLLTHQGFESVLMNSELDDGPGGALNTNKELPPPPPPKENDQPQGFLQRAKSVVGGARKPRPMSYAPPAPISLAVHEDPATAPSIPLQRSNSTRMGSGSYTHRRSTSEMPQPGAASVVNNMIRQTPPSGPTSPSLVSPRNSFFGLPIGQTSQPASRVPSNSGGPITEEETKSSASDSGHVDTPSPPRRTETTAGGVMTGKQMRPLRLVQNEVEAERARKIANRASWITGWFGNGEQQKGEAPQQQ